MCLVCDRIQMIKENTNPWFVKELETGYVVIGDNLVSFRLCHKNKVFGRNVYSC